MESIINGWKILEEWRENRPTIKPNSKKKYSRRNFVRAICPECLSEKVRDKGTVYAAKHCWDCRLKIGNPYGDVTITYFNRLKKSAIERNLVFEITIEYISNLFKKQNGKCAYSGKNIGFIRQLQKNHDGQTASLDRIDSSKGYVEGNVQWIWKDFQWMKMDTPHNEFIKNCHKISNYQQWLNYQAC